MSLQAAKFPPRNVTERFQALIPTMICDFDEPVSFDISIDATFVQNMKETQYVALESWFVWCFSYLLLQFQLCQNKVVQTYKLFAPSTMEIDTSE